jgi:hypothetical protein
MESRAGLETSKRSEDSRAIPHESSDAALVAASQGEAIPSVLAFSSTTWRARRRCVPPSLSIISREASRRTVTPRSAAASSQLFRRSS